MWLPVAGYRRWMGSLDTIHFIWAQMLNAPVCLPQYASRQAPGADITLITKTLSGVLPSMSIGETLQVTKIYCVADLQPVDMALMGYIVHWKLERRYLPPGGLLRF